MSVIRFMRFWKNRKLTRVAYNEEMEADLENLILSSLTLSDFHHSAVISKFIFFY